MKANALPRVFIAALAVAISATACDRSSAEQASPTTKATTTSTSTTSSSTTTTTAPPVDNGLGPGSRGPAVEKLENMLAAQKYDPGTLDSYYDSSTGHAVMAFQKVHGLKRTGRATQDVLDLIGKVGPPEPLLPAGGATRVEVDLHRQILMLFKGGSLYKVVDVSTGSGKRYCVDGECATAVTPGGSFKVFFRRSGIRVSRLGKLFDPLYFNGGIAIHGAPSVPSYPASHGCVRIPMYVSKWFPGQVPNQTPVYVIGGEKAAVPFNEAAPDGTTGAPGPSTTSTVPPTSTTQPHILFPPPATTSTTSEPEPTTTTTV